MGFLSFGIRVKVVCVKSVFLVNLDLGFMLYLYSLTSGRCTESIRFV